MSAVTADPGPLAVWDPPNDRLASAARSGFAKTGSFRIVSLVVQFASAAALARILGPTTLGIIALSALVTSFTVLFNDLGLGAAIVQRAVLTEDLLSAAFWTNVGVGVVLAGGISAASPFLGRFFNAPRLTPVLIVASLTLLLSVSLVQRSLLQRSMQFTKLMALDLGYGFVSAIVSVVAALLGAGALSVAVGAVVGSVFGTVFGFHFCSWRPHTAPKWHAVRSLANYSVGLLGYNVLDFVGRNIDNVLVGRVLGTRSLGFYSRAYNLAQLPVSNIGKIFFTVMFPALSAVQDDATRFRRTWLKLNKHTLTLSLAIVIPVVVSARHLVFVIYGPQWRPMVTALIVLMCVVPAYMLSANLYLVYLVRARTGLQFKLSIAALAGRLIALTAGVQHGYLGVAYAMLAAGWFDAIINTPPALKLADASLRDLAKGLGSPVCAGATALGAGLVMAHLEPFRSEVPELGLEVLTVLVVFGLVSAATDREGTRRVLLSQLRKRILGATRHARHRK